MSEPTDPAASGDRLSVPDPDLMRRGAVRMSVAAVIALVPIAIVTIGGASLVAAGELPGLALAVGGLAAAVALVATVAAVLRVRGTLSGGTVSAAALRSARGVVGYVRSGSLLVMAALLVFGLVRMASGDGWTLLVAGLICLPLWAIAFGARRLRNGYDAVLNRAAPGA